MDNKLDNLSKLLILRDVYRQGWKSDWNNKNQIKYVVYFNLDKLKIYDYKYENHLFSFPTRGILESAYKMLCWVIENGYLK